MGFHSQSIEQFEFLPKRMSTTADGWPDEDYSLISADGWLDMATHAGSAGCCTAAGGGGAEGGGAVHCSQAVFDGGQCGGNWSRMVRERIYDFFNGSRGDDVGFTHRVIVQGNLPYDRDDLWRKRGYGAVNASAFDPLVIRSRRPTSHCTDAQGRPARVCLPHSGKIRYGTPGRAGTGNDDDYPAGRLKMFDDMYSDVSLSERVAVDRAADTAYQTSCDAISGTGQHTCDPASDPTCCRRALSSDNDDDGAALPVKCASGIRPAYRPHSNAPTPSPPPFLPNPRGATPCLPLPLLRPRVSPRVPPLLLPLLSQPLRLDALLQAPLMCYTSTMRAACGRWALVMCRCI